MKRVIEIRAAEGGDDSKLWVKELAAAYIKHFTSAGWKHRLTDSRPGELSIEVEGADLSELNREAGGHRVQRVPATERKGRVHSSTATVAVIEPGQTKEVTFNERDFKTEWYSGTGAGGQHRNKHQNSSRITHIPTGIIVTAQCRSRENSLTEAKETILARLNGLEVDQAASEQGAARRGQIGSGMRGDKIRTYQFQNGIVTDHRNGKKVSVDRVMKGNFQDLWGE